MKKLLILFVFSILNSCNLEAQDKKSKSAIKKDEISKLLPIKNDKELWGFINNSGELVIPFNYRSEMQGEQVGFSEGLVVVGKNENNQKYGFINKKNTVVIDFKFDYAENFKNGVAYVIFENKKGYINKNGDFTEKQKVLDTELELINVNGKYGIKNKNGNTIIEPKFTNIRNLDGDLISIQSTITIEDKINGPQKTLVWGFINRSGETIIEPQFNEVGDFAEGLAPVQTKTGKWGYIDINGKMVITPQFSRAYPFSEGLACIEKRGNFGFINIKGEIIIEPKFKHRLGKFKDGYASTNQWNTWKNMNYINKKGKFLYKSKNQKSDFIGRWNMNGLILEITAYDIPSIVNIKVTQGMSSHLNNSENLYQFKNNKLINAQGKNKNIYYYIDGEGKLVEVDEYGKDYYNKTR